MKTDTPSGQTAPPLRESGGRHAHSPLLKTAAAVLLLLLAAALFCGAAAAETADETAVNETHTHDGITFQPWDHNDSLPDTEGSYYLTKDVTISKTWTVPSGTINLCLNGYVITQTGEESVITVGGETTTNFALYDRNTEAVHYFTFVENGPWTPYNGTPGASVDLKDFKLANAKAAGEGNYIVKVTGGCITGGRPTGLEYGDMNGGGVCVDRGTFTMNGGTIIGNSPVPYEEEGEIILCDARGGGVYVGTNTQFIMNGGYIAGNNSPDIGGGVCLDMGGTFTMKGGSITGNTADSFGGGVYVEEDSSFTMNDGSIKGNTAGSNDEMYGGGGVYIYEFGVFTMTGGSITENSTASGGGVYLEITGTFTMTGGSITENTASVDGGGVYVNFGTFNIGGSPVIKDNTRDGTTPENVYLEYKDEDDSTNRDLTLIYPLIWKKTGTGIEPAAEIWISSPPLYSGAMFGTTAFSSEFEASLIFATGPDSTPLYGSISGENLVWKTSQSQPAAEDFVAKISSTGTEYTYVAAAIAEAQEGDTVVMIKDSVEPTIFVDRKVTLDLNGHVLKNNGTSLNTGNYYSVIMVESGGDLTVKDSSPGTEHRFRADQTTGLWTLDENGDKTVTGGCITGGAGTEEYSCGGGVYVAAEGTFTMENGNIVGNKASLDGGGVYVKRGKSTFIMNGGNITGNTAEDGGGVYFSGSTFIMNGGNITGNKASLDGGGVYVKGGTFIMNGGTISGNTASPPRSTESYCSGGGVYNLGTFTMNNGTISENVIRGGEKNFGGGVYNLGTFIMNDGNISGNCILEGEEAIGGGVYVASGGTFTLESGSITGNRVETSDLYCYGGGVYVAGTFNVRGNSAISGNTAQGAVNNVHLGGAEKLTLTGPLTEGADIRISKVDGKQIAAGQPFGLVAEDVTVTTDDAKHFHNDAGTLHGKPGDNHTLIWGTTPSEATTSAPFKSDGGNKKTAAVTDPASILQKVTTKESSTVSWLVFKPHETLGDLPVTIDGRDVEIVDDSFKMIVGNLKAESQTNGSTSGSPQTDTDSVTASSSGEDDTGPQPVPPSPDKIEPAAGVQATLSGKLKANLIDGQENKLRLAQKTDADKWVLHPVSNGKKTEDGEYYTFDAAFTSTKNGGYMFVIAEGTDPTPAPKSSSTPQGTSIWLTAEPTPTETPAPTPTVTPAPEVPSVKPVEQKPAAQTGASPAPVMGVLAGLGCAAVLFGLRRK